VSTQFGLVGAGYSSVLVRQHAGIGGPLCRRRSGRVCGHRGARSAQGRSSVRGAGARVQTNGITRIRPVRPAAAGSLRRPQRGPAGRLAPSGAGSMPARR